jgi:PAS domain S-box-containing protein
LPPPSPSHAPSRDEYALLIDSVQDSAIFMLDTEGHVATWNLGAEKIKGYTASEIVGTHFSKFYTPEDIAAGAPTDELSVARAEGRVELEGWRLRKDGSRFWANVTITALRDESGKLRGFAKVTRDLTERRRVQEELARSEERFRLLVEAVSDYAIYMLDPSGRVTTWNSGAEKINGYASAEILGQHFAVFFVPEDVRAGKPDLELKTARSHGRIEDEGWRLRKDGSRFWANAVVTAVRDAHGRLLGFAKVTRDLTARRVAEETARELIRQQAARSVAEANEAELRESQERYQELSRRLEVILEGLPDGVTVQTRTGEVIFANTVAARLWGFTSVAELLNAAPGALSGRFELFDERGEQLDVEPLPGWRVLRGATTTATVARIRERDTGRERWSRIRASSVPYASGEPDLVINIWHDVTEERRRQEHETYLAEATIALAASLDYESTLATVAKLLVPGLGDWCAIHLLEGNTLKSVAVAHVDPEKVALARKLQSRYPPDPEHTTGVWNVVRTGKSELYPEIPDELLMNGAQDAEHLEILRGMRLKSALVAPICIRERASGAISLISTESGRRFDERDVALVEELGRTVAASIENAKLYEAAQQSAKDAAAALRRAEEASRIKDEFLATVSHELRTPLQAIVGWSSLLRERNAEPAVAKGIDAIHRNAQAQSKLIEDILDVSRIITGKLRLELRPTDLVAVMRDAVEVVRASATAKGINIDFTPPVDACLLVADSERLQQVVWNLLSNAVKFTDAGGRIAIDIRQHGSRILVSVADTGRGIEPEFLPYVFDRFKQADSSTTRRVGGLGLGLAIVRHITELHGGQVEAHSQGSGKGAVFTIALPVRAVAPELEEHEQPVATPARPARHTSPSLQGLRVLIVDDEPDARELLQTVLSEVGGTIETAASASEGFEALQRFRPHVLVSDIGMPDVDGYAFMRRIRELDPLLGGGVPAIALTAYTRAEEKMKAISAGFTTHIGKPVNPDDLLAAVANLARFSPRSADS